MMKTLFSRRISMVDISIFRFAKYLFIAVALLGSMTAHADDWLNDDPNAIWGKPPGFYKEGSHWYAVFHAESSATQVKLTGDFGTVSMIRTPDGKFWWFKGADHAFTRVPKHGDRYKFELKEGSTTRLVQDPAARWVESSALSAWSKVYQSSFSWTASWSRPGWEYYNIYQVHPLRFTDRNNGTPFGQIIEEMDNDGNNDYINSLGVTAIQLLPVNEFAGDLSWGYNPSFFYAVESSYGGPDELKKLVDTTHKTGKAVILDVVYNHASSSDNILWSVDNNIYFDGDTVWGPLLNFDNDIARHFLIQNLVYLAKEFRIDGFRFDHTNTIHNRDSGFVTVRGSGGGWEFLRKMRSQIKDYDNKILLIAEELPDWWGLTDQNVGSSWGGDWHGPMDSQWTDNFHDKFKNVIMGGPLNDLRSVFMYHGDTFEDGLIYSESHDEVGNEDKRIAKVARDGKGWEMNQISLTGTVLGRGIPMAFMGQEAGEVKQFHIDGWGDRLDLDDYTDNAARNKIVKWYKRMNDIRRDDLWTFAADSIDITHIHDDNGVAAFTRNGGEYLIVLNFKGKTWSNYGVGVSGNYKEIANTSWPQYNIGEIPQASRGMGTNTIHNVHIPAYGAVVLQRQ